MMMENDEKQKLLAAFVGKLPENLVFKLLEISSTGFELDDIDFKASREHRLLHLVWRSKENPRRRRNSDQIAPRFRQQQSNSSRVSSAPNVMVASLQERPESQKKPKKMGMQIQYPTSPSALFKTTDTPTVQHHSSSASEASTSSIGSDNEGFEQVKPKRQRHGAPFPAPLTAAASTSTEPAVVNRFEVLGMGEGAVEELVQPMEKEREEKAPPWAETLMQNIQRCRETLALGTKHSKRLDGK